MFYYLQAVCIIDAGINLLAHTVYVGDIFHMKTKVRLQQGKVLGIFLANYTGI